MAVYVEILIRAPLEDVWTHTQRPELHERWDVRFTDIDYLPGSSPDEPQRFEYATRLGFGLAIGGEGEFAGQRDLPDGARASALRFWSGHPLSLIREGSGYWKYVPTPAGIRFLTSYDYRTRFGRAGRLFDRLVFRPLMAWATAWSFDRLRVWLEDGIAPSATARAMLVHAVSRVALAAVFAYHALFLKLLWPAADEIVMIRAAGVPTEAVAIAMTVAGVGELALGASLLFFWRRAWPSALCVLFATATTLGVAMTSPERFGAAFNPATLNLGILALALIDLVVVPMTPSASRCTWTAHR